MSFTCLKAPYYGVISRLGIDLVGVSTTLSKRSPLNQSIPRKSGRRLLLIFHEIFTDHDIIRFTSQSLRAIIRSGNLNRKILTRDIQMPPYKDSGINTYRSKPLLIRSFSLSRSILFYSLFQLLQRIQHKCVIIQFLRIPKTGKIKPYRFGTEQ